MQKSKEEIDNLIVENTRLIYQVIKELHIHYSTEDELQDYYDAGLLGMIKAAKYYDEKRAKISTFFCTAIANEIKHFMYTKTMKKRFNENGPDISLYQDLAEDLQLIDTIVDDNQNVELKIEKKLESERLLYAINKLPNEKDKIVIYKLYGLNGYKEQNGNEIAEELGVSKEAINSRKLRSIRRLKKILEKNKKEAFVMENKQINANDPSHNKSLSDLNNLLFTELERLSDIKDLKNVDNIELEIKKSKAITNVAQTIINNAHTLLEAQKFINENKTNDNVSNLLLGNK